MPHDSLAAVFNGPGQGFELRRLAKPALGPDQMLVRVTCCTVCGSDLHTYAGERETPLPTILGHEVIGRIEAWSHSGDVHDHTGAPLRIGDRVTWSIAASCGSCFFCSHQLPQKSSPLLRELSVLEIFLRRCSSCLLSTDAISRSLLGSAA